ncbi:Hypothetical_protein [Hexamita inflata]|uniref:Hypothetical_protein n=1 Tax=Hexamita inflata TaxID=28002 RepID=A0AA86U4C4_9EUKA|nr:Hypothetical protein HINF_LOCUS27914 [Hexamita inflata]
MKNGKEWFQKELHKEIHNVKELCIMIDALPNQTSFWEYQEKNIPGKSVQSLKSFYKATYKKELDNQLTTKDIEYIKQYTLEKMNKMSDVDIAKYLIRNYFIGKAIYIKQLIPIIAKFANRQNVANIQGVGEETRQRLNYFTQMIKAALTEIYQTDHSNKEPKELCSIIDNSLTLQTQQFWKYLSSNVEPKKTITQLKQYYKNCYLRILHTDRLTETDKQYITELWKAKKDTILQSQFAKELMKTYFKDRDVFYCDVQGFAINSLQMDKKRQEQLKKNLIPVSKDNQKQNEITSLFQKALSRVLHKKYVEYSPKEICEKINNVGPANLKLIFEFVLANQKTQVMKSFTQLKSYFLCTYQRAMYSDHITKEDQEKVLHYLQNTQFDSQITKAELSRMVQKKFFNNRDIFPQDIIIFVRERIYSMKQFEVKNYSQIKQQQSQQQFNQYIQWYQQGLKYILKKDFTIQDPKQLIDIIKSLEYVNKVNFWKYIQKISNKTINSVQMYFKHEFCSIQYSYKLAEEDKQYMDKVLTENGSLLATIITKQLLESYFKDKDVFPYNIYKYVYHWQTYNKKSLNISHEEENTFNQESLE